MRRWAGLVVAVGLVGLVACSGDDGAAPAASTPGPSGAQPATSAGTRFVDLRRARAEIEAAACDQPIDAPAIVDGLAATLVLRPSSVAPGADFAGTVTVTNTTSATVAFDSGSPVAAVVVAGAAGGMTIVASYASSVAGVGLSPSLAPGASVDIPVVGATASCDPALGHALPAGTYEVRVVVPVGASTGVLSAPAALTVTG